MLRGSLLLLSVVALFVVAALSVVTLSVTLAAISASNRQQEKIAAFNLAESGAEVAAQVLKDQPTPPSSDIESGVQTINDGVYNGSYSYRIRCTDPTAFLRTSQIRSVGTARGGTKTVEIMVKQATFGKYAYFTDMERSSVSGSVIWWMSRDRIDGPAHSNNTGGTNFNIDYNGSTGPIFQDIVTGAGSTMNYSPRRPRNENEFKLIFANDSKGYKLGVPRIELPPSTALQKNAAWGATSGFPSANGVYLRAGSGGGIYIQGDSAVTFSVDASGNQRITVVQGANTTVVTLNKSTQTTTVTGPVGSGSPTSAPRLPNGVIYSAGNITSLSGTIADNKVENGTITVRSAFTVATDTNNSKDITITGNLVCKTRPDKTKPPPTPRTLPPARSAWSPRTSRFPPTRAPRSTPAGKSTQCVWREARPSPEASRPTTTTPARQAR